VALAFHEGDELVTSRHMPTGTAGKKTVGLGEQLRILDGVARTQGSRVTGHELLHLRSILCR
jgi:hypothetical protein